MLCRVLSSLYLLYRLSGIDTFRSLYNGGHREAFIERINVSANFQPCKTLWWHSIGKFRRSLIVARKIIFAKTVSYFAFSHPITLDSRSVNGCFRLSATPSSCNSSAVLWTGGIQQPQLPPRWWCTYNTPSCWQRTVYVQSAGRTTRSKAASISEASKSADPAVWIGSESRMLMTGCMPVGVMPSQVNVAERKP